MTHNSMYVYMHTYVYTYVFKNMKPFTLQKKMGKKVLKQPLEKVEKTNH